MFTAVSLGVFNKLHDERRSSSQTLSRILNLNEDALTRLLDACVGLNLLRYSSENENELGFYENTPIATTYLCDSSPFNMNGYILCSNELFWGLWGKLEGAIREGTYRYQEAFGASGPEAFSSLFASKSFLMGMHGYGQITSPILVDTIDLKSFKTLVDLGGGTGHVAIAACKKYPDLNAKLVELPAASALAKEIIAKENLTDRIEVLECNFFNDELPDGDIYCLARILHDWQEDKVLELLKRIFEKLPPNGALIIAEKLLDDNKSGPYWAQMQNLNMLVIAQGMERTFKEYKELLVNKTGFESLMAAVTDSPLDFILATKPGRPNDLITVPRTIRVLEPSNAVKLREREIKRAELLKNINLAELFFKNASVGFAIADMEGDFIQVNEAFADIVGWPVDDVMQMNYKEFTRDIYAAEDQRQMENLRLNRSFGPFEKQYVHRDGHYVLVQVTLKMMEVNHQDCIWALVQRLRDPSGIASRGGQVLKYRDGRSI
jgi:acetylserotonin N-methyltransferase